MGREVRKYLRRVRRGPACFRKGERLRRLNASLEAFAEDCPAPEYRQIVEAFGPPEEMARTLMGEIPLEESSAYFRWERVLKAAACVLLLVSLFAGWMWGQRTAEVTVTVEETTIIGPQTYVMGEMGTGVCP